jgi:aspartyl-tRNA(Asn)/glutamyl-tRNA(Gln) amidotransferase subunit A
MDNLFNFTVHELHELLLNREISSVEITRSLLTRINELDKRIGAYVTVNADSALNQAEQADRIIANGDTSPLTGIPILIKDIICTKNIRTTCCSKILENFIPPYDACVVEKLKSQNAVILGKANMDEFAMGSSTEHSAFHPTHNPWDLSCVPGGSSGGSAAAVAADLAICALGTDTGGSVRQPAAFCGTVGLKPTYGRVSRYGLVAFASSLDQIGPICKDAIDCGLILNCIAGHDKRDSTSLRIPVPDYIKNLTTDIKGLRIGVPREYFVEGMQEEVRVALETAVKLFEDMGAVVDRDVSLPYTKYALAVYYILAPSEASANLARFDGVKYGFSQQDTDNVIEMTAQTRQFGFGPEVKRRIMLGTYALSAGYYDAYYRKAQKVRTLIRQDFEEAFKKCDVLLTPTSPTVAFKIGEKLDNLMQMYLSDVCTLPINIAGVPAISVPAGFAGNLPIGMQIIAKHFDENTLLKIAYSYEQATNWHMRKPDL